jgi:multiple sugar transport system permease protein
MFKWPHAPAHLKKGAGSWCEKEARTRRSRNCLALASIFILIFLPLLSFAQDTTIRMMASTAFGIPQKEATDPRSVARRAVFEEFQKENPTIHVENSGGLNIDSDNSESAFLMSMAGDTAPDVFYVTFRQYYDYINQGFCRLLDDLIAQDPNSLQRINPTILKVLKSADGHIYAMPFYQVAMALYYRKDYFLQAGLDPGKPPQTWDEFYKDGQQIEEKTGHDGFAFSSGPGGRSYHWINFVWQAGGEVVAPASNGEWKSVIASPQTATALDFYRRLVLDQWKSADGKTYGPVAVLTSDLSSDISAGKVAMWFSYTNDVVMSISDVNPSLLGVAALPAGPTGRRNEINAGMWAINATIKDPAKIAACWKFIKFFSGDAAARINTEKFVENGEGNLVNPVWLRKFGYPDLAAQADPNYVRANEEQFKTGHPEPYGRNCEQIYHVMDDALDEAKLYPSKPALQILQETQKEMDQVLLGYTPPDVMRVRRAWAAGILGCFLILVGWISIWAFRKRASWLKEFNDGQLAAGTDKRRVYRFIFWCLLPASLSILVWSYYPLLRGLVIAFQDYHLIKGARWVGLDNFISAFTQPVFWRSLLNSFIYVVLSLVIGFFLPILLALALNEIPKAKVFFRTIFYLPAMTSPILISFLWRQIYENKPYGLLNATLSPFIDLYNKLGLNPIPHSIDWLGNPSLAMFAVVLPGIWAGAGPGSILYLAALKNVPQERYEAADIDGATWWQKIYWITMPGIKPLVLINLLGVFIAGFKTMENVFVLTGGGPLNSTRTIGLEIWENAFMYLRFGYATAAAWVMGSILIGFTIIQIRSLTKMSFKSAG